MALIDAAGVTWRFPVEWSKVREFARAVHDRHGEGEYLPVPPTFPTYGIAAFGLWNALADFGFDPHRILHGEEEYVFRRPLRIGDRLACRTRLVQEYTKKGQTGGTMRFVVVETEMRDERTGDLVVSARTTAIETAPR